MEKYGEKVDYTHLRGLRQFGRYWDSIRPRKLCFACLLHSCQFSLPCGHTICEPCYLDYLVSLAAEAKTRNNTPGDQCPFCIRVLGAWKPLSTDDNHAQIEPNVNFKIGATVLKYHALFMAVIDIGLKIRTWSGKHWTQNVTSAVLTVLDKPENWMDWKGGWANTWRNIIDKLCQNCPYQRDTFRNALRQAFEVDILEKRACPSLKADSGFVVTTWNLLASFFSFELVRRPRRSENAYVCVGRLKIQHADHHLLQYLRDGMENQVRVCVDKIWVPFRWPCIVEFGVLDLFRPFNIRIVCGEMTASIAGFPTSPYKLIESRTKTGNAATPRKQKRGQKGFSDHDCVKRLRTL